MTKRGRPQNVVFDKASGRGMTINQFTKRSAKEMRRLCLTRSEIVKRKLLTKSVLGKADKDGHIPVAPYLVSLQYLNDEVVEDRELGVEANLVCFHRGFVDELWLYGDKISEGMKREIALAKELKIPVVAKTEWTKKDLEVLDVVK